MHFILLLVGESSLSTNFDVKFPRVLNSSKSLKFVYFLILLLMKVLGSFCVCVSISVIFIVVPLLLPLISCFTLSVLERPDFETAESGDRLYWFLWSAFMIV